MWGNTIDVLNALPYAKAFFQNGNLLFSCTKLDPDTKNCILLQGVAQEHLMGLQLWLRLGQPVAAGAAAARIAAAAPASSFVHQI